ncbi:MAG: hypothetical protein J1F22_06365 [Lachnospiraceae bacterium]|nr:hypothetical protein [Lachnospiraceae bacterium]
MVKNIYKVVALIAIFTGALFFFGRQMETDIGEAGVKADMTEESFPYLEIEVQGQTINPLYGYSAPMEPDIVRESMTPLEEDKKISLIVAKSPARLTRLRYQIIDKESGEIYDTKEIKAISKNQKKIDITFDYGFKTSTEYILDLMVTTDTGRQVHYYTRLKYYMDESNFVKKLAFVKSFHKDTFTKSKAQELGRYLEPSAENRNATLATVDITSNSDLVTWGGMSPKVISDEMVTIKEYNMETACIQYNYFVRAQTSSGEETYHIKEFYRVRHASGQNYLLNFERTMDAEFDVSLASSQTSQLKLGITNDTGSKMLSNKGGNILYFVRDGVLYRYQMDRDEISKVYSVFSEKAAYQYRAYNEQGIRLLKIDEEGNLYFCIYGYFPRGNYEGDVALVLYEYTGDGELNELVYMPISTTYQQLKEDFEDYGYVSPRGIYYFTVANTVYAYNMSGKRLEKLAENIKSNSFMTMESANCYVWSSSLNSGYGESITIYNLETDERQMLYQPDKNTYIRLLGVNEDKVIYGYVKKKDIVRMKDGTRVIPSYELYIVDIEGKVWKKYKKSGRYIQNIVVNGNVINMTLCKKNGKNSYEKAGENSILNSLETKTEKFSYSSRVTNKSLTEWYIRFPASFEMKKIPVMGPGPKTVMTSERYVRLEQPGIVRYYVYAVGKITESFEGVSKAIREADKQMGVVISSNHQVVWERSGSFNQNNIGGITMTKAGEGVSNLAACAHMVLKQKHVNVEAKDLSKKKSPVYDMLAAYMQRPVNLKGCTLEQVLYFVSGNKPVIAMTGDSKAVVIAGYTEQMLYLYDPATGRRPTVSRSQYEEIFKNAGNRFISYMEK